MDLTQLLSSLLGIGLGAGVNLYAVILTVGVAHRLQWIQGLPEGLTLLSHPVVMGVAAALYLLEFVADKIPGVTPFWDGLHTVIRPLGAVLLALGAFGELSPLPKTLAMIAAGTLALGSHATKMGTRLAAHAVPDPATHSAISVLEDFSVVGLILLAYNYPWVALPLLLGAVLGILLMLPFLWRVLVFLSSALWGRLAGGEALRGAGELQGFVRAGGGLGRLRRATVRHKDQPVSIAVRRWWRSKQVTVQGPGRHVEGILLDFVEWPLAGGRSVSVYLTKNWAAVYRDLR